MALDSKVNHHLRTDGAELGSVYVCVCVGISMWHDYRLDYADWQLFLVPIMVRWASCQALKYDYNAVTGNDGSVYTVHIMLSSFNKQNMCLTQRVVCSSLDYHERSVTCVHLEPSLSVLCCVPLSCPAYKIPSLLHVDFVLV